MIQENIWLVENPLDEEELLIRLTEPTQYERRISVRRLVHDYISKEWNVSNIEELDKL